MHEAQPGPARKVPSSGGPVHPAHPVPFVLRAPRPGDLGWIVERHGALAAREFGWDVRFEARCARMAADFAEDHDPHLACAWIAELEGARTGCALCVRDSAARVARLRLLLVEPQARGLGLGRLLMAACEDFARGVGYRTLAVTTEDAQTAAGALCRARGFTLTSENHHHSYGRELVRRDWHLVL
jgi:GNAT superfamily N-acetyltransferase